MKEIIGTAISTIVIVGTWNKAIFTPEWIKENILSDIEYFNINVPFPTNNNSLKFSTDSYSFCVIGDRLVFEIIKPYELTYLSVIKNLRTILRLLLHTPVFAFGVNFSFESNTSNSLMTDLDDDRLFNCVNSIPKEKKVTFTFPLTSSETLNFSITSDNNIIRYNYNFDYKIKNTIDIVNIIEDDAFISQKKEFAMKILSERYNENIE